MNEPQPKSQRSGLLLPLLGLAAVIIIAVAVVASRPGPKAPETASEEAPAAAPAEAQAVADSPMAKFKTPAEPQPIPTTGFKDANDSEKTLADFGGKVMVVNFWATWCAPCIKEMPTLDALQGQMGGDAFQVVAISQDREGAQIAKPFVEKNGWQNLAVYTEASGHFAKDAGLSGLPTSIIVDKTGHEVARVEGEVNWTAPEVVAYLQGLTTAP